MLQVWDAIEADFLRDYRIRLVEQIDDLTWRQFNVLLNNLSPHGALAMRIRAENEKDSTENTTDEEDERAANSFFSSVLAL